ncbi:MAG: site-2 protease family protein [Acidobacteria bacterium]|nr:site-2 protease family protein [Acidobacteriota bacterium]
MFGRSITLFHLFGFRVRADASWLIIAALVTWSLAVGVFPGLAPDLDPARYWLMGIAGTIILFLSIIVHEFAHALVARQFGIPMKGITLFLFGGVAEMDDEPPSAKAELLMAIAGPIASVFISITFFIVALVGELLELPREILAVLWYLGLINAMLVVFNMLPAFPLDGGRVLRSLLWMWKGQLRWATRIASHFGSFFGLLLIVLGIASVFMNNLIGGIWWFLIGMFLRNAASMSYKNVIVREMLQGEPVTRVMRGDPIVVSRVIPVSELVESYVYRYHHKMFPVTDDDRLIGCVTTTDVKELDRADWERQTVGSIARPCDDTNTIPPEHDALEALTRMSRSGVSRLMVVEGGKLLGILTLKDLMNLLQRKMELEE